MLFSKSLIAQKTFAGKALQQFAYGVDSLPWFFFNNLAGKTGTFVEDYLVAVLVARATHVPTPAYDPVLQGGGRIELENPRRDGKLADGHPVKATIYYHERFAGEPCHDGGNAGRHAPASFG